MSDPSLAIGGTAAAAPAHPPITDYRDVWVFHTGVALVNGATGFLTVTKQDAASMILAGEAVDPLKYGLDLPYITDAPAIPIAPA